MSEYCVLPRRFGAHVLMACVALLTACDIPTSPPKWDAKFLVPAKSTTLSVSQLLPSSVALTQDRSAFVVNVAPIAFSQTLGQMCGAPCQALNGLTVPKPAFTATLTGTLTLPSDVVSAAVTSGTITARIVNNLSFDPIRPAGATTNGSITVEVSSGGTTFSSGAIGSSFPPGGVMEIPVHLSAGNLSNPITVTVKIVSPAGDPVTINTSQSLGVSVSAADVRVTNARVNVANRSVTLDAVELSLDDVDDNIVQRIQGGALVLDIANPFGVTGTMTVRITGPTNITKQVALSGTATQRVRIEFTAEELRSFIGKPGGMLTATGTVTAPNGSVLVTPSQVVTLNANFELTISSTED